MPLTKIGRLAVNSSVKMPHLPAAIKAALLLSTLCATITVAGNHVAAGVRAAAAPITKSQIRGCWRKTYPRETDEVAAAGPHPAYVEFCFFEDGHMAGAFFERTGEGGGVTASWKLRNRNFMIDAEKCRVHLGDTKLVLSGCSYAGEWFLQCKNPSYSLTCVAPGLGRRPRTRNP